MIKRNSKYHRGFTLIELLIFLGIFSGLTLICTQILSSVLDAQSESKAISSVQQDGSYLVNRLSYDIGRAEAISQPSSLGSQTSTLQLTIGGTVYSYSLSNGNVLLSYSGISEQLNSYDSTVSDLSFQRLGNANGKNSVRLNFTVTSRTQKSSGTESRSYETTLGLR